MKFVSKFSNYRIVLRQGLPAVPVTGTPAVTGIYVKFEDGILDTSKVPTNLGMTEAEICEKLMNHYKFNRDFLLMEENKVDPYALNRRSTEPEHDILTIEHGGVSKSLNPKMLVDRDKQAVLVATAKEMAKGMFKEMMAEFKKENDANPNRTKNYGVPLTELESSDPVEVTIPVETKRKAGRPPKAS